MSNEPVNVELASMKVRIIAQSSLLIADSPRRLLLILLLPTAFCLLRTHAVHGTVYLSGHGPDLPLTAATPTDH